MIQGVYGAVESNDSNCSPLNAREALPKKRVRAFLCRNDRFRSRKCPLKMTMSGDSCAAEEPYPKAANAICFVSGLAGTRQHGQRSATDSARQFGEYE